MGFDTTQAAPGGPPNPGVPAGTAVPAAAQRAGSDISITFEATRVGIATVDYTQAPVKIRVNNYDEVNELNFVEFGGVLGCCTPIDASLSVLYTVDHEEMSAGAWSLIITSCALPTSMVITPSSPQTTLAAAIDEVQASIAVASSAGIPPVPFTAWLASTGEILQVTGVAATTWTVSRGFGGTVAEAAVAGAAIATNLAPGVTPRGGAGTVVENTTKWTNCSYTVWLTTRPGLTNGLIDRTESPNPLTFCICGH
jgi:hypothetical protein